MRELLLSELELRKQKGESPEEAVYRGRFPAHGSIVRAAFAESHQAGTKDDLSFLQPSAKPDSLGRLGNYQILQILGKGGFGIVLRAFDEDLHRVVAIKVLLPHLAGTSPPRKRFLREARAAASIHHDDAVQIHAVCEQPIPYLVMEYVAGETLQDRLDRNGPLDVAEVLRIGKHIASGLAAAHAQGLIHRDVKPANVLLGADLDGRVKISDFGLARTADDAALTQSGVIAGTPLYMAPEQALGRPLDQRADLFSFGSVLYAMLTGRPPFRAPSTLAILKRVVEDTPRPIRELIPEVPLWLQDVVERLHAKDPEARFASAREVADLLGRAGAKGRVEDTIRAEANAPHQAVPTPRPSRRSRWVAAALLVALFAGLALSEATGVVAMRERAARLFRPADAGRDDRGHRVPPPDVGPADRVRLTPPATTAPFDAAEARAHQEGWAKFLDTKVVATNSLGMQMALIPPGTFQMGAPDNEPLRDLREGPQREVSITRPFRLGVHPVTVGQFKAFVKERGYRTEAESSGLGATIYKDDAFVTDTNANWRNPGFVQSDDDPAVCVSWNDAKEFCDWLGKKEGKLYSLPTEAQWEYACRAGTRTTFSFGDDERQLGEHVWYEANSERRTHPVGQKKPNAWGLRDMHGNVWQWTADWYLPKYYATAQRDDPPGPNASDVRSLRGGDWNCGPGMLRSAFRGYLEPAARMSNGGFRVALVEPAK